MAMLPEAARRPCPRGSVSSQAAEAACILQRLRRCTVSPQRAKSTGASLRRRAQQQCISLDFGQDIAGDNPPVGRSILSERTF